MYRKSNFVSICFSNVIFVVKLAHRVTYLCTMTLTTTIKSIYVDHVSAVEVCMFGIKIRCLFTFKNIWFYLEFIDIQISATFLFLLLVQTGLCSNVIQLILWWQFLSIFDYFLQLISVGLAWRSAAKSNKKSVNRKFETLFLSWMLFKECK